MNPDPWHLDVDHYLIRPVHEGDLSDLALLYSEKAFQERIGGDAQDDAQSKFNPLEFGVLIINSSDTAKPIGVVILSRTDAEFGQRVELLIAVAECMSGRGIATKILTVVIGEFQRLY